MSLSPSEVRVFPDTSANSTREWPFSLLSAAPKTRKAARVSRRGRLTERPCFRVDDDAYERLRERAEYTSAATAPVKPCGYPSRLEKIYDRADLPLRVRVVLEPRLEDLCERADGDDLGC